MRLLAITTAGLTAIGYLATFANASPVDVDPGRNGPTTPTTTLNAVGVIVEFSPHLDPANAVAIVSSSVVVPEPPNPSPGSVIVRRDEVGYCCMGGCTFCDEHHGCYVERKCYYPDQPQFDHCCPYNDGMIWMPAIRDSAQVVMDHKDSFADFEKPVEARDAPAPLTQQASDSQETMPPRAGYCCQGGCHWCSEGHRCVIDDGCFYASRPQYDHCCPYNGNMVWIPGDSEDGLPPRD